MTFDQLSRLLAWRNKVELGRAGFPVDEPATPEPPTPLPLPNLLQRPPRRYMDDNPAYRQEMKDAGRGNLLGG